MVFSPCILYLQNKKIFLFQVAASPPQESEKNQAYNVWGIPAQLISNCKLYFLPGRMIMNTLSAWDRLMLKMGARMTKDPIESKRMLTEFNDVKRKNPD